MIRRLALLALLAACPRGGDKQKPKEPPRKSDAQTQPSAPADATPADAAPVTLAPARPLPAVPAGLPAAPANPRITPEALALGELLFYEPRLARSGSRACSTCHDPATGYSGNVQLAADGKQNLRRTPSLVNLAWANVFGWDGRYASFAEHLSPHLEGQLGDPLETVSARLAEVPLYRAHIARIGGTPSDAVVQALEAFVRTRYEGDSAWDRVERTALTKPGTTSTDPVVAGYQLFVGKAQCGVCHPPPLYTDAGFHEVAPNPLRDPGHQGAFKTPTVRGAAARTSFFHAGTAKTLEDAVAQYGRPAADADPIAAKIRIGADEVRQLVAFLKALTADHPAPAKPVLP